MSRFGRARRVAKWAAATVCIVLLLAWMVSIKLDVGFNVVTSRGDRAVAIVWGTVQVIAHSGASPWKPGLLVLVHEANWRPASWTPIWINYTRGAMLYFGVLPLWVLLAPAAMSAALLWWWDRERGLENMCPRCQYDLLGLASGAACPECGRGPATA